MNSVATEKADREVETIRLMLRIYCRGHHGRGSDVCQECLGILAYARERIAKCPQRADKPTCRKCTIHCFGKVQREKIREVMRYAGPRMVLHHPILSILHWVREH